MNFGRNESIEIFHLKNISDDSRVVEDYGVIYLGSAVFKIARLLFIAMFSVHMFACIFFRIKIVGAFAPEDVTVFYTSKNVPEDVRKNLKTKQFYELYSLRCDLRFGSRILGNNM
jgi:hypothetical protein